MGFLRRGGGYRKLQVYKLTEIIYDISYHFANRYLTKRDRTVDQMVQASRSGKQNIAEGSLASMTSRKTEIKLTNVAKASLGELLIDYEDYVRTRKLNRWDAKNERYKKLREFVKTDDFESGYMQLVERLNDEEIANLCMTLIHQAIYMLDHLLDAQQEQFVNEGGVSEAMTRARLKTRNLGNNETDRREGRTVGQTESDKNPTKSDKK